MSRETNDNNSTVKGNVIMALKKIILNINGSNRLMLCDPEKDTLANLLRRNGMTGTKVGCGTAQCGACSVLVDGEVVRSCAKKMKYITDYTKIETIEGLGQADHLHPLQQAFITCAAVQCGFCTPGFILSAKALLEKNAKPTRQEVIKWFTDHRNVCRCTGYKPIVDAVMTAAAVMRGEKTMDDITYKIPEGSIYGSECPRPFDSVHSVLSKVLGTCDYGDDIALKMPSDTLYLAIVQPPVSHGYIKGIDATEAEKLPGFVQLITSKDVKGTNRIKNYMAGPRYYADGKERPVICDKKVFRRGDIVAVVAARSQEEARKAAALVKVDYEKLPEYMSYIDAVKQNSIKIHENYEYPIPNVYIEQPLFKGDADTREVLASSKYLVEGSFRTSREPHLPLEPDVMQAYIGDDGMITVHCKSQTLQGNVASIFEAVGVPKDNIRLVLNPVGGGFGYSMSAAGPALMAVCTLATGKPVSLTMSYLEHQHFTGKRSPVYINTRYGCDSKGHLTGIDFHLGLDHGAYTDLSTGVTSKVSRFVGYPYNVPSMRGLCQTAFTNHNHGIAYRAFGSPQCYTAGEQMMDMLADKAGIDPFEFRYINIARPGDLCPNSVPYREYPMQEIMDKVRPIYQNMMERAEKESTPEKRRAVGISWGGYHVGKCPDHAEIDLELNPDGSVTHFNCWQEMGQGSDIGTFTHTMEALRPLGLRPDQVHLVQNDTKTCPETGPSSASRGHHVTGQCTLNAAKKLMDAMRKSDGTYRTYDEMVAEGIATKYRGTYDTAGVWADVDPNTGHGYGAFAQSYAFFMADVEVDVATGKARVMRFYVMADVGVIGNIKAVLGQAYGGISHSIGYALTEDYEDLKKHATFGGAGVPQCDAVPDDFVVEFNVTPRANGPHGSTGCSEAFQSSGHVAVLNAIARATGVRIYTIPATPEKILDGMKALAAGKEVQQVKWNLGCDLYERLDYISKNPYKNPFVL